MTCAFAFQAMKELLRHRIAPAVSFTAYAVVYRHPQQVIIMDNKTIKR